MKHFYFISLFILQSLIIYAPLAVSQTWQPIKTVIEDSKHTGLYAGRNSASLVVTTFNNGIFRSTNQGASWVKTYEGTDTIFTLFPLNDQILIAGSKGSILKSLDSGKTWLKFPFPKHIAISQLALHPNGVLFAGTGSAFDFNSIQEGEGVWYSADSGKTWKAKNEGIFNAHALIESITILPDGTILAGIYDDRDFGNDPKQGIMSLSSISGSWQRVSFSVKAPAKREYQDANLHITHVHSLFTDEQKVYAAISGIYTNFAVAFTASKPINQLNNPDFLWELKWVRDSLPADGGYYDLLSGLFTDSKRNQWLGATLSTSGTNYKAYKATFNLPIQWSIASTGLPNGLGKFLFTEDILGNLYTAGYFFGDSVYTLKTDGDITDISDHFSIAENSFFISPNPAEHEITVHSHNMSLELLNIKIMNPLGKLLIDRDIYFQDSFTLPISAEIFPKGIYLVQLLNGEKIETFRIVKQ